MNGKVVIGCDLDTKDFDAEIKYVESQLEEIEYKLKQADMGFEVGDTQKLEAQYSRLVKQLDRLQKKQADLNKTDLSGVQKSIENVGKSTSKVITKMGKWALGIFAIESAYGFVRQAMASVSEYNEQISSDVEYIRFAMASMLQPVIEGLINLAYKLLTYVNYIAKAWFGVDLFANASANAMNKSAKSAEKMKKSLAGFDEMNVLNDNGSTGAMGTVAPSFDLASPEDVQIPSWIKWIADNKDIVIAGLMGISGALIAVHLGLTLIQGLGIGIILAGIVTLIQGIVDFIKDPSWTNFLTILQGIALVVSGIAVLLGGWIVALASLGVAIVSYVIKNWDKVKEILSEVGSWVYDNIIKPVGDFFVGLWDGIVNGVKTAVQWVKGAFSSVVSFFSNLIQKILGLFKNIGIKTANVIGGAFKTVINGVLKAIENILNFPIKSINKLIDVINAVPGINISTLPTFKLPRLAKGGIINQPGRGIPVGSAIGGERGQEGVIPLTDSQQMQLLGEAIGKYINLNATIPIYMGNRQIAREIKKINAQNDFAFNE